MSEDKNPGEFWRNLSADERVAYKKLFNKVSVGKFGTVIRSLVSCSQEKREEFYGSLLSFIDKEDEFEQKIVSFVDENFIPEMKELYEKACFWVSETLKEQNYLFSVSVIMRAFENKEKLLLSERTTVSDIVARIEDCFDGLEQFQAEPIHIGDAGLAPFHPKETPAPKQPLGFVC